MVRAYQKFVFWFARSGAATTAPSTFLFSIFQQFRQRFLTMPTGSEQYSSGVTPMKSSTPRMLLVKELIAINASAGGTNNNVVYTTDPNTDGLTPPAPNSPAFASKNGGGTLYTWNTSTHVWE